MGGLFLETVMDVSVTRSPSALRANVRDHSTCSWGRVAPSAVCLANPWLRLYSFGAAMY